MPILTVELVVNPGDTMPPGFAQSLADALGPVLQSPPGQTWVRVRHLAHDQYAENGVPFDPGQLPVFVTVLRRQIPPRPDLEAEVAALTLAVAEVVGRPASRVHVEYAPAGAGRVAFGGALIR
jgi:phenylpyruvate tautomerase PptA (4-oxalocrotonate tautomerase family)